MTEKSETLRDLAQKATPGPWKREVVRTPAGFYRGAAPEVINRNAATNDADYIAAVDPQAVLSLLDEIERLAAENTRLKAELAGKIGGAQK